ncbi:MAG: hypothetical protein IKR23_01690 [Lachnospiraceae bacterium]|nr:hypothetical protein [Lachnospiraceae bacterium]
MGLFDKMMSSVNDVASAVAGAAGGLALDASWKGDRRMEVKPVENLEELKAAVNVSDPGSVAAYYVYAVMALTADYDTGISMMKYLFADLEPFGRGFTEGGGSGRGGWDTYMNDRLKDDDYRWLPRAYFNGAVADNGFHPAQPLAVDLHFNQPNTDTLNQQSLQQLGRLNIVYWVKSNAAGNQVNIELSRFDGSDRWYVTKGSVASALFYDQRAGLTAAAKANLYT